MIGYLSEKHVDGRGRAKLPMGANFYFSPKVAGSGIKQVNFFLFLASQKYPYLV
jgi:hypothetical protein